jgi:hypothetical protein
MCAVAVGADVGGPPQRPWWAELGSVVPRSVLCAVRAARPTSDDAPPPLAANPLAWATLAVDELAMSTAYLVSRRRARDIGEWAVEDARAAVDRLRPTGVVDNPRLAHPAPPPAADVRVSRRRRLGIDFEHVSFPSVYRPPVALPGATRWDDDEGNRRAHAYLLRHGDRPRPWVVMLHGHRMGEPRDLRLLGSKRLQDEIGADVAHLVLPMHGPRGRGGGHPFPGLDPVTNFLCMAQAVHDARALVGLLRAEHGQRVGAFGISLGGHVAAMLAALEPDLACVVAGVPTSDFATMLADTMRTHWGEETVAASHVLDDASRTLSRLVSPLAMDPVVAWDRRFLYAAIGDRLVTPQQALALWRHWERPPILWLQGGHILNNMGASRRFVTEAFAGAGLTADPAE